MKRELPDGYELDDDPARIDREAVHRYLSEEAYWALGRPRNVQDTLIEGAERVVGLYFEGAQVGFTRTLSDGHTQSYLADVYVLDGHRGRGLGVELVRFTVDEGPFASTKWLLHTADAHGLYERFGFGRPNERLLERRRDWSDAAQEQLTTLARVAEVLDAAGIEYWLFGGWAVDFHHGGVTRAHSDVDIAVWLDDVPRIMELLRVEGWQHAPSDEDNGGTGFERGTVRLELTFLVHEDGRVYIPLRNGRAAWLDDALASELLELGGTRARVVPLGPLIGSKSGKRSDAEDVAKDEADCRVLRRVRD